MAYRDTILVLAASRKHGGLCIAGKSLVSGKWVRPVTAREGQEILPGDYRLSGKAEIGTGDVVEIGLGEPAPRGYQAENHLIDRSRPWTWVRAASWTDVGKQADASTGPLWANGSSSWGHTNNRVSEALAASTPDSLRLIRPQGLQVRVGRKGGSFGDANVRRVYAEFTHDGVRYVLTVTDPVVEREMLSGEDRTVEFPPGTLLCISLGELHDGFAYKLVAGILRPF